MKLVLVTKKILRKSLQSVFQISSLFILFICVYLCSSVDKISAQGLPVAKPELVGMSSAKLNQIDALIEKDIADKKLPGGVLIIGRKGKIVYRKAFGNRALKPNVEKMTIDTIFDAASLTKPVATATSIMILVEQGKIRLNDTIGKFIPEIQVSEAKNITILQLLTHTSGYQPDFDLRKKWTGNDGMLEALKIEKLQNPAGTKFVYSDIGFIVLGEIVRRTLSSNDKSSVSDNNVKPNSRASEDRTMIKAEIVGFNAIPFVIPTLFEDIRMKDTDFSVFTDWKAKGIRTLAGNSAPFGVVNKLRIAPTENIKGQQSYLGSTFEGKDGDTILRGQVHDPTAFRMDGVAGHAGLFTTADDLARYCQMILNGGILDGKRILSSATIAMMTKPYVVSENGNARGLGFDMNTSFSQNRGELFPLGSFGHTGFTGTGIWIDPTSETFVVFMSNRVHPDGKGDVGPLRARISTIAASALLDVPISKFREAESVYNSQVAAQIQNSKFKIQSSSQSAILNLKSEIVLNGIDVLEKENFKRLEGLKIGLVTNQTGRNRDGVPTIDVLKNAPNVKLISLFSPEHGIRGELDQEKINDSVDEKTGLPVYSLYGEVRKPKQENLKDLDAVVFDIQDIGTRFYTYISTLRGVLEECAKAKIPVVVLDRTNPINGVDVEGAIADESIANDEKRYFIAAHTIPVRHGMTIGEIAQMFNKERNINVDLRIVNMENWTRSMWFDQTNQTWINPSPNMRSLTQATLYGGIGMLEYTNLSVGRGTDTPFEVVGSPYIDGQKLAEYLNNRNIAGVRFVPIKYKPKASVFKDENCGGINIVIIDRDKFKPIRVGLEIAIALRKLYPNDWKFERYNGLLVNDEIFQKIKLIESPEEIEKAWQTKLDEYKKRRALYLLY
jgi:uncharacterized protein YbbC (DUF1343 family)/CubicO group peptidase (beta-lactamase class C family)